MAGVGEHVHRAEGLGAVAAAGKERRIPGQRGGVAADVDHPFRGHLCHRADAFRRAARPGRVKKDHVGAQIFIGGTAHPVGGVGADKTGVANAVAAGVGDGVLHGGGIALHPNDLPRLTGGAQPDGADAAVSIHHRFAARETGQLQRGGVQSPGLCGVDLIKAAGGNGKLQPAQIVQNKAGAVQHLFPVAQHGAGAGGIDVVHHPRHPRRGLAQRRHKATAARQHRGGGDQRHQHLRTVGAGPQHHMAQQAGAPVLVVSGVAAGAGGGEHRVQRFVQAGLLQQAVGAGQYLVGALGVQAADQPAARRGKAGNGLVPVMPGLLHAKDGLHRRKAAQQRLQRRLFLGQLLRVGLRQQRTAAAVLCGQRALSFHGSSPLQCGGVYAIMQTGRRFS